MVRSKARWAAGVLLLAAAAGGILLAAHGTDPRAPNPASPASGPRPADSMERVFADVDGDGGVLRRVLDHHKAIEAFGSRMTGQKGCVDTAAYIEKEIRALAEQAPKQGPGALTVKTHDDIEVLAPHEERCDLTETGTGAAIEGVHALLPNQVRPMVTPADGITARLIDLTGLRPGQGAKIPSVENAIVLLDFNTQDFWLDLASAGARAVLFAEPDSSEEPRTTYREADLKYLAILPLDFPRAYVKGPLNVKRLQARAKDADPRVTLRLRCEYRKARAPVVEAILHGQDAAPDGKNREILFTCHFDSRSIVPADAPGGDEAWGPAAWLELLRRFARAPEGERPRATLRFLAFSGHHQGLGGSRAFYDRRQKELTNPIQGVFNVDLSTENPALALALWAYAGRASADRYRPLKKLLYGSDRSWITGATKLYAEDLRDAYGLAAKIQNAADPLSTFLKERIAEDAPELLAKFTNGKKVPDFLKLDLSTALNRALRPDAEREPAFYDAARFARVNLSARLRARVDAELKGEDLFRMNRLLIEEAYPAEIAPSGDDGLRGPSGRSLEFYSGPRPQSNRNATWLGGADAMNPFTLSPRFPGSHEVFHYGGFVALNFQTARLHRFFHFTPLDTFGASRERARNLRDPLAMLTALCDRIVRTGPKELPPFAAPAERRRLPFVRGNVLHYSEKTAWYDKGALDPSPSGPPASAPASKLTLSAAAFRDGGSIPGVHAADGADASPALSWTGAPAGTANFALTFEDLDAPSGAGAHWIAYGLPASATSLPAAVPSGAPLPGGGFQAVNDFGGAGYRGPGPGWPRHRYVFKLYAMSAAPVLKPGANLKALEGAMKGLVLGEAHLLGTYPEAQTSIVAFPLDRRVVRAGRRGYLSRPDHPQYSDHRLLQSFMTHYFAEVDPRTGAFEIPAVPSHPHSITDFAFLPFAFDGEGRVRAAPDFGLRGAIEFPFDRMSMRKPIENLTCVAFPCASFTFFDLVDLRRFDFTKATESEGAVEDWQDFGEDPHVGLREIRDASTGAEEDAWGYLQYRRTAMAFAVPERPVVFFFQKPGSSSTYSYFSRPNPATGEPQGFLGALGEDRKFLKTREAMARDMHALNEARLRAFERFGVKSSGAEKAKKRTADLLDEAAAKAAEGDLVGERTAYAAAVSASSDSYAETLKLLYDVVNTTIFYFILLLPFSFVVERLFFPQPSFPKICLATGAVFLAFVILLWVFHPGFHLASNIWVTIISFIIVILTLPALFLILGRGIALIKTLGSKTLSHHRADEERLGMLLSALALSISNMRRRMFRTLLTLLTVTLLVVALVLLTTSVSYEQIAKARIPIGAPPYEGLQVFNTHFHNLALLREDVEYLEARYGGLARILRREHVNYGFADKTNGRMSLFLRTRRPLLAGGFGDLYAGGPPDERKFALPSLVYASPREAELFPDLATGAPFVEIPDVFWEEVKDASLFAARLKAGNRPAARLVWQGLDPAARGEIDGLDLSRPLPDRAKRALLRSLNALLYRPAPEKFRDALGDGATLARRLRASYNPEKKAFDPAALEWLSGLDDATRRRLEELELQAEVPAEMKKALEDHAAQRLREAGFDPAPFAGVALRPRTAELAAKRAQAGAPDRVLLNRLLIEDAFPEDLARIEKGGWFKEGDLRGVILSREAAERLEVKTGQAVELEGVAYVVRAVFDAKLLSKLKDLDGSPPFPVAFHKEITTPEDPQRIAAADVVFLPDAVVKRQRLLPSQVFSLVIQPPPGGDLFALAGEISRDLQNVDVYVSEGDRVILASAYSSVSIKGSLFMVVPMVMAFFMILSVMMGNVFERTREIHIFSSVGLSPRHVAFMFLIESVVYAAIASVLGYFLGIIAIRLFQMLKWMPTEGFYPNYLGVFVLYSLGLAMLATISSSLYPMWVAARVANPSDKGTWKPESEPKEGFWQIRLPFITSTGDQARAVLRYLEGFLNLHFGENVGLFSVEREFAVEKPTGDREPKTGAQGNPPGGISSADAAPAAPLSGDSNPQSVSSPLLSKEGPGEVGPRPDSPNPQSAIRNPQSPEAFSILGRVILAPFERNLTQEVRITAWRDVERGRWNFDLNLWRLSGPSYLWMKSNRSFMYVMRKQLLLWGSLREDIVTEYHEKGREFLGA